MGSFAQRTAGWAGRWQTLLSSVLDWGTVLPWSAAWATMTMGEQPAPVLKQPNLELEQLQEDRAHPTGTVEVSFSADKQPRYIIHRNVAWDFIRLTA